MENVLPTFTAVFGKVPFKISVVGLVVLQLNLYELNELHLCSTKTIMAMCVTLKQHVARDLYYFELPYQSMRSCVVLTLVDLI